MTKTYFYIIFAFLSIWTCKAYSQPDCTVPLPPVLTAVSVQPETGKTDLVWSPSPSSDIAAYIIYTFKNGDGLPIDTIWDQSVTTFTLTSTATKYFSVSYVVTAHRLSAVAGLPGCTSPLSNVLTTIFCSSELDTCNKKLKVRWNKYTDYPKHVKEYKILVSINGGPLSEMYTSDNSTDNFTISEFTTDSQYCLVVRAVFDDGTESNSNKSCLSTKMQRAPAWINADYASVDAGKKIALSFTIDPLSEISSFMLERKIGPQGAYQIIDNPVSDNGSVRFTDNNADTNTINYYRLSAVNSCKIPVTISNISSNLVLSLGSSGNDLVLSWNSYKKWLGEVSSYKVFINTGKGFEEKANLQSADTIFSLGYKEIMYEVSGNEVCFYVEATEAANPHGIIGKSLSSRTCSLPTELITVPNVFTPDNDMVNDYFRPVLSFTPVDYHLVVIDRKGTVLFETRDYLESWDGSQNGNPQPQEVCLWFLKITTPSGKSISRTGTVTIIHNK